MTTVLVIAAHPDDEVLGCGGTIAKHVATGDDVYIVFMADGVGARGSQAGKSERNKAAFEAAKILGAKEPRFLDFPDNRMETLDFLDIVQPLETIINELRPKIIYTHHRGDLNVDHVLTHQAVITACRPQPNFCVKQILSYEVASSTEWQTPHNAQAFVPNYFVDITETNQLKQKALQAYEEEMRPFPHVRSYEALGALAKWRGASVGVPAAEAFRLERMIQ